MHTTGLILTIFGGVLLFVSAMALSCLKTDAKTSAAEVFGMLILGGAIGFFRDLFRAIAEGLQDRSSAAFPLLVLFTVAVGLLAIGCSLMFLVGS